MLTFPLSKYDKKMLKEFESRLIADKTPKLTIEDGTKYGDIIESMRATKTIVTGSYDNMLYIHQNNFALFKEWVINEDRKSRKPAKREIGIAVFNATVSFVVALTTTLLTLFFKGI